MAGTIEQFSVADLQKLLKNRWPDIIVIGNQPYFDKTVLMRRDGDVFIILQEFDSNYKAFQAIITPGWEPDKPLPIPGATSLFPTQPINSSIRPLLLKLIDLLKTSDNIGQYFGIRVDKELEIVNALLNKQL